MIDRIPTGYRVAVITPDGTIADTFEIEGGDLRKNLPARILGGDIMDVVERVEAQAAQR